MARPVKIGMDYYPKDTDSFGDRKIRKLLKEFSCKGYMIFDYLLCVIYRDKGYYVNYDGEFAFDVADYLGNGITEELVNEVVMGCVRYGLFNKDLFDSSSILTSSGIQNRYLLAKRNGVIDEKIRVKTEETQIKTAESTQSKVKESKVKESKVKESKVKDRNHLFKDSEFFDFEKFQEQFKGTDYEVCDLKIYYEKVKNWSAGKGAKKIDWIATTRNFMLGDKEEGKLQLKNGISHVNNKTQNIGADLDELIRNRYGDKSN